MSSKITYSVTAENMLEIDQKFTAAVSSLAQQAVPEYPALIGNKAIEKANNIKNYNPANITQLLSIHNTNDIEDIDPIMNLAATTQKKWKDATNRASLLRKTSQIIMDNQYELAAIMSMEIGKNRLESLGEVQECVDMITYYVDQFENNHSYKYKMGKLSQDEQTLSILKPYGVFVIIEPFNFPMALTIGALSAALISGNSVVFKVASDAPWSAQKIFECFKEAGLPSGVIQLVQGKGSQIGSALVDHPLCSGVVFTGSYEVGMQLLRKFGSGGSWAKPCITEMGGKNPGIVCPSADIDKAVTASWKSAFGLSGQKCSELSRLIVHKSIAQEFKQKLIQAVGNLVIGDPLAKETFIGPVINQKAVDRYHWAVEQAQKHGGKILLGGDDITKKRKDLAKGFFVEPTIVEMDHSHPLTQKELFLPFLNFYTYENFKDAISMANDVCYGLTAGIFSKDEEELNYFFNHIEAGCTYANRPTGITTGAWPGVNTFCGWKGSGSSGKGFLGPHYVAQFMREQSQTRHPSV